MLKKFFQWNLTQKFLLFILLLSVVPLLLLGWTSNDISKTIIQDEVSSYTQELMVEQKNYMELMLQEVESMIANVSAIEEIKIAAADSQASSDDYAGLVTQARIGYILSGYTHLRGLVSIDIFTLKEVHYHVGDTLNVQQIRKDLRDRIYAEALNSDRTVLWTGIEDNVNANSKYGKVITAAKILRSTDPKTLREAPVALLLVNLSVDSFSEHFSQVALGPGAYMIIVDGKQRIVFSPNPAQIGQLVSPTFVDHLSKSKDSFVEEVDGQTMFVTYSKASMNDWRLVSFIPLANLTARVSRINENTIWILTLSFAFIVLLAFAMSKVVVEPIKQITERFISLQEGTIDAQVRLKEGRGDEIGELFKWFNTFVDSLAAKRQAEFALAESEERLNYVLEGTDDGVWDWNFVTGVTEHSERWAAMLGYRLDELAPNIHTWENLIHPDDLPEVKRVLDDHLAGRTAKYEAEYRMLTKAGAWKWILDRGKVVARDAAGKPLRAAGTHTDIDARKQLEATLQQQAEEISVANTELAKAARLKDEFLASMSHELRTPLNTILGMSEALREQVYGPLTLEQEESLESITESGQHLLNLINDILDLSKIEAGKMQLALAPVLLEPVCEASLRFIKQDAHKKNLQVTFTANLPNLQVRADARRLKQVLVNLLNNAVKFTPSGGQLGLCVQARAAQHLLELTVWDTGIGITPEDQARLFKPFVQLDSRLSRQYAGTGLGLSLVARIAEMHGGSVTLESEKGVGSRFTVTLPWDAQNRDEPVLAELPDIPANKPVVAATSVAPRILVVDDNESTLKLLGDFLRFHAFTVQVARNGYEAITHTQNWHPDLIVMDIQMPGMDGFQAIRLIRENPAFSRIPILAVTALAMLGDRDRCLQAGANAYLTKPVDLHGLIETIRVQLGDEHVSTK